MSADLTDADLSNTTLIGTNFKRADLTNADLSNADISNAFFKFTDLSGADLTNIIGWETATFNKASYTPQTLLPNDMIPQELNMKLVPLPAGIYLFLSGVLSLGLMRCRKCENYFLLRNTPRPTNEEPNNHMAAGMGTALPLTTKSSINITD